MVGAGGLSRLRAEVIEAVRAALGDRPVLVALSGGADSAVAAWAAVRVAEPVRAVFVHHGYPESDAMEHAAVAVAGAIGVPLRSTRVSPASAPSPENQARLVRLAALEEIAGDDELIVTGHHGTDRVESLLLNLARGAGSAGLSGMVPERGRWCRPLLGFTREQIRDLAGELELPFTDDPANASAEPRRNRVRSEILPRLRELGSEPALIRSAGLVAADDALLESGVPAGIRAGADGAGAPAGLLATLPGPTAARLARRLLRAARPPYAGSAAEVAAVLAVARSGGRVSLSGDFEARRHGPWVVVGPVVPPPPPDPARLPVPGVVEWSGIRIEARAADGRPRPHPLGSRRCLLAVAPGGFTVRPAAAGDRVDIGGGTKAVFTALAEAGVPARCRPGWPLVTESVRILWVAGVRVARGAGPVPGSHPVVELSMSGEMW